MPAASKYAGEIVSPYGSSTELFSVNSVVPGGKIGIPRSPPVKGTLLTVPAAVTPGMLRTASSIAFFFIASRTADAFDMLPRMRAQQVILLRRYRIAPIPVRMLPL